MSNFIDTSAFMAILNANDQYHASALPVWRQILSEDSNLYTSNYVLLETTALLQHRFGIEAVRLLESDILPILEILWVDETIHLQAVNTLLGANRRQLSLVDCTSFILIRQAGIDAVFTFDPHFQEQGFKVIP